MSAISVFQLKSNVELTRQAAEFFLIHIAKATKLVDESMRFVFLRATTVRKQWKLSYF